ncbi:MAG: class I SAM-dependent methyltransferase [Gammaproteobacteria bacterium]|nr:class I SAM-dependent methyltransferase [Gammaproteobacteria bacterium]
MNKQQRQRIVDRHKDALLRHGHHPNALYWSSREIQEKRFQVLSEIGIQSGDSVLDVGCGFGDLAAYLEGQNLELDYTGIDLSPDLIEVGREKYPQAKFSVGDLFDFDPAPQSYDYVLLSGALAEQISDNGAYARRVIERIYAICRKGVAFNLLDARNDWVASRPDLQSFHPDEIMKFCKELTEQRQTRDDYLDNDFTVYLRRVNA